MSTYWAEHYQGADGSTYRVARVDKGDTTPVHAMYPTGYDSRCGLCWLGASHSDAAHAESVAAYHRGEHP